MAHTPGPWKANRALFDKGAISWFIESESGETVARIFPGPHAEANAHLFVAAPDLLAACENLLAVAEDKEGVYGIYQIYIDRARAAIAKARES